ncbi:MAG: electron transfer flavoprotein subunit alpha/FixB family protein [Deltaproteobacteria bacterium]|nr:MAG: electron transfer flavoprotein subunit alpha/FixB family protein [Deltaproteobacteria bacterium]
MTEGIWIIAEQREGELRKVSFELASEARRLADTMGQPVAAILLGSNIKEKAAELGKYGADKVIVADDDRLATYTTDAYVSVIAQLAQAQEPAIILLGASVQGKDLSGRLAARLGVGVAQDCVAFSIEDGNLVAKRPIYAGKAYATVTYTDSVPQIATARPNVFELNEPDESRSVEVIDAEFSLDDSQLKTKVVEVMQEAGGKVDLTEAERIVSGGRGMKGPEEFAILEELADLIAATVGASRSVVDAGWRPHSDQVGQTGKVVSPNLYIACGISGAIQHLAGMSTSKTIVAINKDPEAPIFQKADYGVVGDLFEVVPALTEALKKVL